jgi:hypothetical protein
MASRCRYGWLTFLVLLPIAAPAVLGDETYTWRYGDNQDGSSLVLGSTETTDDFVLLLSCEAGKTDEMAVYLDIGHAKAGQPVTIELSRDGAEALVKAKTTADKSGFVFAVARNFPVKPLLSVLGGEGPVKMIIGKRVTLPPDEGRSAELAAFAARCSPD